MSFSSNQHPSNYSNIINNHNNIQGVQINYSNQIIQNGVPTNIPEGIPIQQFANTLIMGQNFARGRPEIKEKFQEQSSNESLLNSHRRCKSQNVRGDPSEEGTSSVMDKKKTSTNKKKNGKGDVIRGGSKTGNYNQDMPDEILILHQGNSAGPQVSKKVDPVIMNLEKRVNDDSFVSNGQGTLENFNYRYRRMTILELGIEKDAEAAAVPHQAEQLHGQHCQQDLQAGRHPALQQCLQQSEYAEYTEEQVQHGEHEPFHRKRVSVQEQKGHPIEPDSQCDEQVRVLHHGYALPDHHQCLHPAVEVLQAPELQCCQHYHAGSQQPGYEPPPGEWGPHQLQGLGPEIRLQARIRQHPFFQPEEPPEFRQEGPVLKYIKLIYHETLN
eukprot:CAMPEP_0170555572 /NCGR_PEP_ID=MMETSP0211-20121228/13472_1 /TAXON_ID=311385 /ORGANISM="Pseudokeronopsis sp., Strain OXSARD2" /LENGTH=383 /DNA_ID=CAMNT_0010865511 /DNA_START=1431 /DNA_END=2581 /DNA_ORIENTATION=+